MDKLNMDKFKEEYTYRIKNTMCTPDDNFHDKLRLIKDFVFPNIPPLYRFRQCKQNHIEAFEKDWIYHSEPFYFNDPHDCLVYFNRNEMNRIFHSLTHHAAKIFDSVIKSPGALKMVETLCPGMANVINLLKTKTSEDLKKIHRENPQNIIDIVADGKSIFENVIEQVYSYFRNKPKIACFSEDITSTVMWAHYSNYHKGFALEYDFTKTSMSQCLTCEKNSSCSDIATNTLLPIVYSEERYDATDMIEYFVALSTSNAIGANVIFERIPDALAPIKANLYKGLEWGYENEWRSIMHCENNKRHSITMLPTAVYLGAEMIEDDKVIIKRIAEKKKLKIYNMKVDHYDKGYKIIPD